MDFLSHNLGTVFVPELVLVLLVWSPSAIAVTFVLSLERETVVGMYFVPVGIDVGGFLWRDRIPLE